MARRASITFLKGTRELCRDRRFLGDLENYDCLLSMTYFLLRSNGTPLKYRLLVLKNPCFRARKILPIADDNIYSYLFT